MLWVRWSFLAFNVVACVAVLFSMEDGRRVISRILAPSPGVEGILDIVWWANVWQLIGVALVVWLNVTAWNLLWWFALGLGALMVLGKLLLRIRFHSGQV